MPDELSQISRGFSRALTAALILASVGVHANSVTKIDISSEPAEVNKPVGLTFTFAVPANAVACGLSIDWGDGQIERLRFGEGQQVSPPFRVDHTYLGAGQYKLRVVGEPLFRGLRSVPACDLKADGTLEVIDSAQAARLAAEKAAVERQQRERAEAEARARREREEALAARAAEERAKREAEALAALRTVLARASIKSCDQFVAVFKSKYEYAYDWPSLTCSVTTDNDAAFVILARNSSRSGGFSFANYFYQPRTETVLGVTGNNVRTTYRALNFVDVRKAIDMNAEGDIELRHLPDAQRRLVCDRISSVTMNFVSLLDFRSAAGYEVAELANAGNWDFTIKKVEDTCEIRIAVAGIFKGNSYRKDIQCTIGTVVKRSDGKYMVKDMGYSRRQGCR